MAFEWVPGTALGIAGAALAWWRSAGISEAKLEERLNQIKDDMAKGAIVHDRGDVQFHTDLTAAISELRAVTLTIAKLSAGQEIVNQMTAKTLDSIARKMEDHDKQASEFAASISFIRQLFERMERSGH